MARQDGHYITKRGSFLFLVLPGYDYRQVQLPAYSDSEVGERLHGFSVSKATGKFTFYRSKSKYVDWQGSKEPELVTEYQEGFHYKDISIKI